MPPRVTLVPLAVLLGTALAATAVAVADRHAAAATAHAVAASPHVAARGALPIAAAAALAPTLLPIPGQPMVEPPLRGAAGTPCEVEIFHDVVAMGFGTYVPPAGCPGPWSKVLLKLDVSGPRSTSASNLRLTMDDLTLFWGAPQEHDGVTTWHLVRDVTDYASFFRAGHDVFGEYIGDAESGDLADEPPSLTGIAKLVFYPATSVTPAQHVPARVRPVPEIGTMTLPTNIERAYVDVHALALDTETDGSRAWFTCVPTSVAATWPALLSPFAPGDAPFAVFSINRQGCRGGSFREVEVRVDGELAGVAPLFPWLPSDLNVRFRNTVDLPAPSVQALNAVPYRVDITPYAARLNDGLPHAITVRVAGSDMPLPSRTAGALLLYLDKGRRTVTGAVTLNNLTSASPSVSNTLAPSGDALTGAVHTTFGRNVMVRGYVDTSHGRIYSQVTLVTHFDNVQQFALDGLAYPNWRGYRQTLQLSNTYSRTSTRWPSRGSLQQDHDRTCTPLRLDWSSTGSIVSTDEGDRASLSTARVALRQERRISGSHDRIGMPRYTTELDDVFASSHARNFATGTDSAWNSRRNYVFQDNAGSCYSAALTTANGVLASSTLAAACPGGNVLRWFAHADGSPEWLGWGPAVP